MPFEYRVRNILTVIALAAVVVMACSINSAYQMGVHDGSQQEAKLCAAY